MQSVKENENTAKPKWHYLVWHIRFLKQVENEIKENVVKAFIGEYKLPISSVFLDDLKTSSDLEYQFGFMIPLRYEPIQYGESMNKLSTIRFEIVEEYCGDIGTIQETSLDPNFTTLEEFLLRIKSEGLIEIQDEDKTFYLNYAYKDPRSYQNKDNFAFHKLKYLAEFWVNQTNLLYIPEIGEFVIYNPLRGVYEPIIIQKVKQIIYKWLDANDLKENKGNINDALDKIQTEFHKELREFDSDDNFVNVENGLIDVHTKQLFPHRQDHYSLIQYPFKYTQGVNPTPCWDSLKVFYPRQMRIIELFIKAVFYDDLGIAKMLFILGKPNTGKSTVINVIRKAFGNDVFTKDRKEKGKQGKNKNKSKKDMVATFGLNKFEDKRVLAELVYKRLNVDPDMRIGEYSSEAMANLKKIVVSEPIDAEPKYHKPFNHLFHLFILNGTNQFGKLPPSIDREGFFKRVCIIKFDHVFDRNDQFEGNLSRETSAIMSNLIQEDYEINLPEFLMQNTNYETLVKETMQVWDENSDPIARFVKLYYERTEDPDCKIPCSNVQTEVQNALDNEGIDIPIRLINQITMTLKMMGIYRKQTRSGGDNYVGIKRTSQNPNDIPPSELLTQDSNLTKKENNNGLFAYQNSGRMSEEKLRTVLSSILSLQNKIGKHESFCFEDVCEPLIKGGNFDVRSLHKIFFELEDKNRISEISPNRFQIK